MTREKPHSEHRPFTELPGLLWRQGQDVAEVLDGVPLLRGSQQKKILKGKNEPPKFIQPQKQKSSRRDGPGSDKLVK